jgi:hypothetical protein
MTRPFSLKSSDELEAERIYKQGDRMLFILGGICIVIGLTLIALGGKL